MKKELSQQLQDLCPNLYVDMWGDWQITGLSFGIEAPDDWFEILKEASLKLEQLILKIPLKLQPQYKAAQVKNKFGQLRFYMSKTTPKMDEIISKAEDKISKFTGI